MFDTHCHLNFKSFEGQVKEVIERAKKAGVSQIVVPGTDVETSEKAIKITKKYNGIYAAVGIHPHHVYEIIKKSKGKSQSFDFAQDDPEWNRTGQNYNSKVKSLIKQIEELLINKKVVAIGEVGIDRHIYQKTKYQDYKIEKEFVELQKVFLKEQIKLAIKYDKSLILHNREAHLRQDFGGQARKDMFEVLQEVWDKKLEGRTVFHCCEPDFVGTIHELSLLEFAQDHKMFIGVDGDVTYYKEKQQFIKTVPLEMLVLETDSPFLSPTRRFLNEPKNIVLIAEFVAKLKNVSINQLIDTTTENARVLFRVSPFKD